MVGMIGIGMGFVTEPVSFGDAVVGGVNQTLSICGQMFKFIWGLASGQVSIEMVSGPVGIARIAGQVAREGWFVLMNFMAVLSLNLAILNILPIPVLDGGHLVFLRAGEASWLPAHTKATGYSSADRARAAAIADCDGDLQRYRTVHLWIIDRNQPELSGSRTVSGLRGCNNVGTTGEDDQQ